MLTFPLINIYSHLFNSQGGWNKRGGGAKVAKSINVEGGIFWKKIVNNSNKRGVEGGFCFCKICRHPKWMVWALNSMGTLELKLNSSQHKGR